MRVHIKAETSQKKAVAGMRKLLDVLFEAHNAIYMTGDRSGKRSMIGYWTSKPKYVYFLDVEHSQFEGVEPFIVEFERTCDKNGVTAPDEDYDIPWCIDLCCGEMELPTLGLTLPLEEWVLL